MIEHSNESTENPSSSGLSSTEQISLLDHPQSLNVPNLETSATLDASSRKEGEEIDSRASKPAMKADDTRPSSTSLTHSHYQDTSFSEANTGYCSFSSAKTASKSHIKTESNAIQTILDQTSTHTTDLDDEEDEQKKKIAAAKRLLFPNALAASFPEVSATLRNERRQEFCPIYQDETAEQTILRQSKQKPVGSLLAKRIRWDDLKRKREEEEEEQQQRRKAQMQYHYGPYGAVNPQQQSFANPYEQYYATMQNQYEQMVQVTRIQQQHSAFWPEYHQQQASFRNNDQAAQNTMQYQAQPYMYPYMAMQPNYTTTMNNNASASPTYADYNTYLNNIRQPPPPPPDEPYPY